MKLWLETVAVLACLLATGCRTDPNIVLLERENRELEDTIYELQACIDQYQQELETCRQANLAPETNQAGEAAGAAAASQPRPAPKRSVPAPQSPRPPIRKPPSAPVSPEELVPPKIEMPGVPLPEGQVPESFKTPGTPDSSPPLPDPARPGPSPLPDKSAQATPAAHSRIAAVVVRPQETGGYNRDGRGGDDGLRAVIEPHDAQGQPCLAPGPVSVVVLDPAIAGEAARIARWDFTAEEVARRLSRGGIRLEMVWPQSPPVHDRLHLYVRYTTDDGRKLEADCPIEVAVASRPEQWAPALLPPVSDKASNVSPNAQEAAANKTAVHPAPQRVERPGQLQAAAEPLPTAQRPVWSPNRR